MQNVYNFVRVLETSGFFGRFFLHCHRLKNYFILHIPTVLIFMVKIQQGNTGSCCRLKKKNLKSIMELKKIFSRGLE